MCQVSAFDSALMDAANEDFMRDTAVVKRADYTDSQTAEGTFKRDDLVTVVTTLCLLQPADMSGKIEQLREIADQFQGRAFYQMVFPRGTDVRIDDSVFIGVRSFEVVADGNALALAPDRRVFAVEVVVS